MWSRSCHVRDAARIGGEICLRRKTVCHRLGDLNGEFSLGNVVAAPRWSRSLHPMCRGGNVAIQALSRWSRQVWAACGLGVSTMIRAGGWLLGISYRVTRRGALARR